MTRPRDIDPALLARYLSGESTPAESALVRAWSTDPRHRAELDALQRAWSNSVPLECAIDVDAAWRKESAGVRGGTPSAEDQARPVLRIERAQPAAAHLPVRQHVLRPTLEHGTRLVRPTRMAGLAAAAAILIASSVTMLRGTWPLTLSDETIARTTRDFAAGQGQRALIDLADGTHIVLAPATRLQVSLPVGRRGVRELTLDGEAMFTVTHDPARPFVVHTRYGTTVDIGTSFAVRAYAGEAYRVVVRDGQVALGGRGAPVLIAGDVAERGADGKMLIAHGRDATGLVDWTNGRLTFAHTRFADLVPELERWYGVTIHIATPALRDRVVTGQLDTESRTEAMDALGRTLGAQHVTDGAHVTFSLARGTR
jgi:transmembrane sensor